MEKGAVIAEKNLAIPTLPDGEAKRIFIGGIGAGVMASDLEHTFSPPIDLTCCHVSMKALRPRVES